MKFSLKTISPKRLIVTGVLVGAPLIGIPIYAITTGASKTPEQFTHTESERLLTDDIEQMPPSEDATPAIDVATPEPVDSLPDEPEVEPTNPYTVGSNIRHVFERRTALGMATPSGPPADIKYCSITYNNADQKQPFSTTPSVGAIACMLGGMSSEFNVFGVVDSVDSDGSFKLSCTLCIDGSGSPDSPSKVTYPSDRFPVGSLNFRFIQ